jgi:hypothetical protein
MMQIKMEYLEGPIKVYLDDITQIIGSHVEKKAFIIETMIKHFSKHKYSEDEEMFRDNITVDNQQLGRGYFAVSYIDSKNALEKELTMGKSSLIHEYFLQYLEDFDLSRECLEFEDYINKIIVRFNDLIKVDSLEIDIEPVIYNLMDIIKNHICIRLNYQEQANLQLLPFNKKMELYLELLSSMNQHNPQKRLIIFDHIEEYLHYSSYKNLIHQLRDIQKKNDITFLITSTAERYCCVDERLISGINIFGDQDIHFSSLEALQEYTENHYPINKTFATKDFCKEFETVIHQIGTEATLNSIQSQVLLKLINASEFIETKPLKPFNLLELKSIQSS